MLVVTAFSKCCICLLIIEIRNFFFNFPCIYFCVSSVTTTLLCMLSGALFLVCEEKCNNFCFFLGCEMQGRSTPWWSVGEWPWSIIPYMYLHIRDRLFESSWQCVGRIKSDLSKRLDYMIILIDITKQLLICGWNSSIVSWLEGLVLWFFVGLGACLSLIYIFSK